MHIIAGDQRYIYSRERERERENKNLNNTFDSKRKIDDNFFFCFSKIALRIKKRVGSVEWVTGMEGGVVGS